jgi:copper(I)-binding protein
VAVTRFINLLFFQKQKGSIMKKSLTIFFTGLMLISNFAFANSINIEDAYVRATPPNTQNSAAFMVIHNTLNKDVKLVSASSDIAQRVELHEHIHEDGMMKMRQVEEISIQSEQKVALKPGGYHVMFLGLKEALKEGNSVQFSLYFDNGDKIMIDAPIKKINSIKK